MAVSMPASEARAGAMAGSASDSTQGSSSVISHRAHSPIVLPLTVAVRGASASRVPPQSGQGLTVDARSTNARMWRCRDSVSLKKTRRTLGTSPS